MSFKHPDFLHTGPLEVAISPRELKKYYMDEDCCFVGIEGDNWLDMIACKAWPDVPYYAAYYSIINREWLSMPELFAEQLVMISGRVIDIEDIPEPNASESLVLIHKDITISVYQKVDDLIAVIESIHTDSDIEIDMDDLTLIIGVEKFPGWKSKMVGQILRWTKILDAQRLRQPTTVIEGEASRD